MSTYDDTSPPDVALVVPVNADGDLPAAAQLLDDMAAYRGSATVDLVFVVNNFDGATPPTGVEDLAARGARVIAVPDVREPGRSVGVAGRARGLRETEAPVAILLDADCRVPNATALVDWYLRALSGGAMAAYTGVRHHELSGALSVRVRVVLHHMARWLKRRVLRIPTLRGSNYGVRRADFLALYDAGLIRHDIHVGPAVRRAGGRIVYSGRADHVVYTSGRFLRPGWRRLARYMPKRLRYNIRMMRGRT